MESRLSSCRIRTLRSAASPPTARFSQAHTSSPTISLRLLLERGRNTTSHPPVATLDRDHPELPFASQPARYYLLALLQLVVFKVYAWRRSILLHHFMSSPEGVDYGVVKTRRQSDSRSFMSPMTGQCFEGEVHMLTSPSCSPLCFVLRCGFRGST